MSDRNEYFASVFSRELDSWKKRTGKNQAMFAEHINVLPDMISRYKKGKVYPTEPTLQAICKELGVDSSIFFPQTFDERFQYDYTFRRLIIGDMLHLRNDELSKAGIDLSFWKFFWSVPGSDALFPFAADGESLFVELHEGRSHTITSEDLGYIHTIQEDVKEYITMLLVKKSLQYRIDNASDGEAFIPILMKFSKELLFKKQKEAVNGND